MSEHLDDRRPFTRDDAVRHGVDPRILRTSRYRRIFRGIWIRTDAWQETTPIEAALALHPEGAVASHFSAARLFGLPVPDHPFEHVTVFDPDHRRYRPEIKSHVTIHPMPATSRRGLKAAHPFRTFVDLAGWVSLVDLVAIGDAMVRVLGADPESLVAYCRDSTDYYAGPARLAASYVRTGVDSPMETRLRMLIVLAGLPEPKVNHVLYDRHGNVRRRLDLSYPGIRLIIEYDGRHHIERVEQWSADLERREELEDGDWKVVVVTAADFYRHPTRTLERIRRSLVQRGWGPVPPINPAWAAYFSA
ncbi:hypothetical protein [Nocardioides donggukensis]|uniref:DUF559 domain-containing protein n=1 Tax=Nocardioides donggukensis TaxID=2774019 RepID=A0A927Q3V7_9ACTN|nr:hypothetical protein [Nocardioides donggukensis]MBD8870946.1 hypothetical protein [Nocardioides donggukensis]